MLFIQIHQQKPEQEQENILDENQEQITYEQVTFNKVIKMTQEQQQLSGLKYRNNIPYSQPRYVQYNQLYPLIQNMSIQQQVAPTQERQQTEYQEIYDQQDEYYVQQQQDFNKYQKEMENFSDLQKSMAEQYLSANYIPSFENQGIKSYLNVQELKIVRNDLEKEENNQKHQGLFPLVYFFILQQSKTQNYLSSLRQTINYQPYQTSNSALELDQFDFSAKLVNGYQNYNLSVIQSPILDPKNNKNFKNPNLPKIQK